MKKLITVLLFTLSLISSFYCSAKNSDNTSAKVWLEHLSTSLKTLNFSTSFVVVKNNQAEPYHWYHGVDHGRELEILSLLNGPRQDTLRKGNVVSYIEPNRRPYSVKSERISGPIPSIFSENIDVLSDSYDFISVGKSRILGRAAQMIRIVAKDGYRYGYWLWLDQESGLLLKMAVITRKGHLLEQVQFTYLEITKKPAESLERLIKIKFPDVIDIPNKIDNSRFAWQINWLPLGFKQIKADRHNIDITKQAVEFRLFSDSLVDISVYVSPSQISERAVEYVKDGATIVLNQIMHNEEISVVGKIPPSTAKAIADSVSFRKNIP